MNLPMDEKKYRLVLDGGTDSEQIVFAILSNAKLYQLKAGVGDDCEIEVFTTPSCLWNHKQGEESNRKTLWLGELHLMASKIEEIEP